MKLLPTSRCFDPICGMWLDPAEVKITFTYIGRTYAFCCQECHDLFARTPDVHVVRLAHDPEAYMGHWCPFLSQTAPDEGGCRIPTVTQQLHPDDLGAFALGALDPEEAQPINAHLADCAACRGELAAYQLVVGMLCFADVSQEPPAHLRERILSRIAADTQFCAVTSA